MAILNPIITIYMSIGSRLSLCVEGDKQRYVTFSVAIMLALGLHV